MQEQLPKNAATHADELQKRSDILDGCLQAIAQKKATVDSCVRRYPDFVELRDLLYAAEAVQHVRPESLSLMSKNAVRERVLEHYRTRKSRPSVPRTIRRAPWFRPLAASFAIILIIFVSGFGLVKASAATLPGDSLYPVKRAAENLQVAFTSGNGRTDLLQNLAEIRLSELSALADQSRPIPLWALDDTSSAISAVLLVQPDPMTRQQLFAQAQQVVQKAESAQVINSSAAETVLANISASSAKGDRGPRIIAPTEPSTILPALAQPNGPDKATEVPTAIDTATPTETGISTATPTSTDSDTEPTETVTPLSALADLDPTERPDPTRPRMFGNRGSGQSGTNPEGGNGTLNPKAKGTPKGNANGKGNSNGSSDRPDKGK